MATIVPPCRPDARLRGEWPNGGKAACLAPAHLLPSRVRWAFSPSMGVRKPFRTVRQGYSRKGRLEASAFSSWKYEPRCPCYSDASWLRASCQPFEGRACRRPLSPHPQILISSGAHQPNPALAPASKFPRDGSGNPGLVLLVPPLDHYYNHYSDLPSDACIPFRYPDPSYPCTRSPF